MPTRTLEFKNAAYATPIIGARRISVGSISLAELKNIGDTRGTKRSAADQLSGPAVRVVAHTAASDMSS